MDKCAKTLAVAATTDKLRKRTIPPVYTSSKIRLGESSPSMRQTSSKALFVPQSTTAKHCSCRSKSVSRSCTPPKWLQQAKRLFNNPQCTLSRRWQGITAANSRRIWNTTLWSLGYRRSLLQSVGPKLGTRTPQNLFGDDTSGRNGHSLEQIQNRPPQVLKKFSKVPVALQFVGPQRQRKQRRFTAKNTAKNATRFSSENFLNRHKPRKPRRRRSAKKQRQINLKSSPLCTQGGNVWKNLTLASSLGRTEKEGDTSLDTTI